MIISWRNIKEVDADNFGKYISNIRLILKNNERLVFVYSNINTTFINDYLEYFDIVIYVYSKEGEWSFNQILKDRYGNNQGRYISDDELLVYG